MTPNIRLSADLGRDREASRASGGAGARCGFAAGEPPGLQPKHGSRTSDHRPQARQAAGDDRHEALRATLLDYRERMHANEPVHTWDAP